MNFVYFIINLELGKLEFFVKVIKYCGFKNIYIKLLYRNN